MAVALLAAGAAVAEMALGALCAGAGAFGCGWLRLVMLCEVVACVGVGFVVVCGYDGCGVVLSGG